LRRFQPENAPIAFGDWALPRLARGAYSAPPDLAGFKSGGRDKGRRKTRGDRQLREGGRGRREGAGREKGREWEENGSRRKMHHRNPRGQK